MSKAYDRLSWGIISQALDGFGIKGKSHDLIMQCIFSPSFVVLVNDTPTKTFIPSRGIRQGCPLSPYLFIMSMEILSTLILSMERNMLYESVKLNHCSSTFSHLAFADDVLLFGKCSLHNITQAKVIIQTFEQWSGQPINFDKSSIFFSKKTDPHMCQLYQNLFGVKPMDPKDKYLGHKILQSKNRVKTYSELLDTSK